MIRRGLFLGTAGAALGLFLAQQGGGQEDDMVSTFTISGPVTQAEGNSGTTNFTYTITRTGALSAAGQVSWAVTGTGANPANAADFVGGAFPSGTASFAAGAATANVVVQVQGDTDEEADETFTLTLSSPRNTAVLGSPFAALGTITNDDTAPPPSLPVQPLASPRSIYFDARNGRSNQQQWLQFASGSANMFGNGTTRADGCIGIQIQLDQASQRSQNSLPATTENLSAISPIFSNGGATSAVVHLAYVGAQATPPTGGLAGAFFCRLGTVNLASQPCKLNDAVYVLVRRFGTSASLDVVLQDGSRLEGPIVDASGYNGTANPATPWYIGRGSAAPAADAIGSMLKGAHIARLFYMRRDITNEEASRLGRGEEPDVVLGSGVAWYYRLSGVSDLTRTAGSEGAAACTIGGSAPFAPLRNGPTLAARWVGTKGVAIAVHAPGYVAGTSPTNPAGARPMPHFIRNAGGGATHMRVRACVDLDGQTSWRDWVRVTSTPLADGAGLWFDLPGVNPSDWLVLEVEREDEPTCKAVSDLCGVGPKLRLMDAQSTGFIPAATMPTSGVDPIWAQVAPGGGSLVSGSILHSRTNTPFNCVHEVIRSPTQFGVGFLNFAKQWNAQCAALGIRRVCHITNTAVPGVPRANWYSDAVLNGSYRYWGDNVTQGSGMETDVRLRRSRGGDDVTASIAKPGSSDLGDVTNEWNRYYLGGGGAVRWLTMPAMQQVHPLTVLVVSTPRYLGANIENDTEAEQIATTNQLATWRSNLVAWVANTAIPGKQFTTYCGHLAFDETGSSPDKVHHGISVIRGAARFFGLIAFDAIKLAWLRPSYTPTGHLPATFSINPARNLITIPLNAVNGGTFVTEEGGSTVGGAEITTDGGASWAMVDATLAGNELRIAGNWLGIPDNLLRVQINRAQWPRVVAASSSNADVFASIVAENALLPRAIYERTAWGDVPVYRNDAPMAPA